MSNPSANDMAQTMQNVDANNLCITIMMRNDPSLPGPFSVEELSRMPFHVLNAIPMETREARYGSADAERERVEEHLARHAVRVVRTHLNGIFLCCEGSPQAMEQAFGVRFEQRAQGGETFVVANGRHQLPAAVDEVVAAVVGLDQTPLPRRRIQQAAAGSQNYLPTEVASLYNFPAGTGAGQAIGIIEMGGGYNLSDLNDYFTDTIQLPAPPTINSILVNGGVNDPSSTSGEVYLDIEVAGAIASGATINVYFGAGGANGFLATILASISNGDDVITMSVEGVNETGPFYQNVRSAFDFVFAIAGLRQITVLHGCGDRGAWGQKGSPPTSSGQNANVIYPPSSPLVTAVGGVSMQSSNGGITSESVWNTPPSQPDEESAATGGGVSVLYDVPSYQSDAGVAPVNVNSGAAGRGVPDVAAIAGGDSWYSISVAGQPLKGHGGDSSGGPFWAALVAILNENLDMNLGFLNSTIYSTLGGTDAFRDITTGDNTYVYEKKDRSKITITGYSAAPGWDACTGYGTPDGSAMQTQLQAVIASATDKVA